ncbi:MAG: cellulase family glycosylhydrolase [Candidatus Parcubacteria bacterium]|nr:cellulase family glycosylhydrolase [Candidatus Parcubacteria bacterium]
MKRFFKFFLIFIALAFVFLFVLVFLQPAPTGFSSNIRWGAAFSKPFAIETGLDWKETYLAILDDLKVKNLRLPIYWPDIEPQENNYVFDDYDWMLKEAKKRDVKLVLVIGKKLPRWPECYEPNWVKSEVSSLKTQDLLNYIEKVVNRYKNSPALYLWQVENEPFLPFGECPTIDDEFLGKEIELVRSLDQKHQILTTDSGELGLWLKAAKQGDIFGTTIYRVVWSKYLGYIRYDLFLPRQFFWLKANLTRLFYPAKPIIVSELQAEPWMNGGMDLKQFSKNIEFAKKVGFPEVYLWGAEWWYLMKVKQNDPSFWELAKKIF